MERRPPNRPTNRQDDRNLSNRRLQFNPSRSKESRRRKCNRRQPDQATRLHRADRKAKAADSQADRRAVKVKVKGGHPPPTDRRATADKVRASIVKAVKETKAADALKANAVARRAPVKDKVREAALTAAAAKAAGVPGSVRKVSKAEVSRGKDRMPAETDWTSAEAVIGLPGLESPDRWGACFRWMSTIM